MNEKQYALYTRLTCLQFIHSHVPLILHCPFLLNLTTLILTAPIFSYFLFASDVVESAFNFSHSTLWAFGGGLRLLKIVFYQRLLFRHNYLFFKYWNFNSVSLFLRNSNLENKWSLSFFKAVSFVILSFDIVNSCSVNVRTYLFQISCVRNSLSIKLLSLTLISNSFFPSFIVRLFSLLNFKFV